MDQSCGQGSEQGGTREKRAYFVFASECEMHL